MTFPSLLIRAQSLHPQGSFAEAQARYLAPDPAAVSDLTGLLRDANVGVVAHFYMDAELQGTLGASDWPHIHVSDSLEMSGRAVEMAKAGVNAIIVLGVDFMSENVRAVLRAAGFGHVPVYRLAAEDIGCSLAESAEAPGYARYLRRAAEIPRSLHVVYINTSLRTKAVAQQIIPTITCTSSNVVKTLLQAAHQVPGLSIWYGPDSYMGANLKTMLDHLLQAGDEQIAALHAGHNRKTIAELASRFHYFDDGVCIVHHMFGSHVVDRIAENYTDAFLTAHLEVPGEMFALASEAQRNGRGVVGSTSQILGFICDRVDRALTQPGATRIRVVLGTEAGMITGIVRSVQHKLEAVERSDVEVEIIFPVASEAIAQAPESELKVVPGAASGEGCSVAGGCATCPFMKMNNVDSLFRVVNCVAKAQERALVPFRPKEYGERTNGKSVSELGTMPILQMRHFQKTGNLSDELVAKIQNAVREVAMSTT